MMQDSSMAGMEAKLIAYVPQWPMLVHAEQNQSDKVSMTTGWDIGCFFNEASNSAGPNKQA